MNYIFLSDGFEEIEAVVVIDVLRRANINIKSVSISNNKTLTGSHGITMISDLTIDEVVSGSNKADLIVLPGGMPGTTNLKNSKKLATFIEANKDNALIAAICAAPIIIGNMGLLKNKGAVCFPGFEDELIGAHIVDKRVVKDGNFITSKGPGTSIEFALEIVKSIKDSQTAQKISSDMEV